MTFRNYDYLPDDADALRAEIARLDRDLLAAREECGERIRAAVLAEREACAAVVQDVFSTPGKPFGRSDLAGAYRAGAAACLAAIRSRPA